MMRMKLKTIDCKNDPFKLAVVYFNDTENLYEVELYDRKVTDEEVPIAICHSDWDANRIAQSGIDDE